MKPLHKSWKQRKATGGSAATTTPRKPPASEIKTRLRKHMTSTPSQVAPLNSGLSPIATTPSPEGGLSPCPTQGASGDPLDLAEWGLPAEVVAGYARRGMRRMFPWQLECLRTGNVLAGAGNLVYSAPTSAGKTLVAEVLMLKRILETKTKAFLVLPFVSLAREKELALAELFGGCGVRVGGFLGQRRPPGGLSAVDLAVCTIERANGLLNGMLLDGGTLGDLGILVVDELHLVGDAHRGYLLELMLTKVAYAQKRGLVGPQGIQVVAMSATLANLGALAKWLAADLYQTDFRPVPLRQFFKLGGNLCEGPQLRPVRRLLPLPFVPGLGAADDPEGLLQLCLETWAEGHALLVFCPTRRWCEALATSLARCLRQLSQNKQPGEHECELVARLRSQMSTETGRRLVERLRSTPGATDPALASCLSTQVAFHHAGLTMEERDLLEGAFREGSVRALVATTTLSSGVNLPARRVIIRSANFGLRTLDSLSYHQMVGRAGRMGLDTQGESILMCREADRALAQQLSSAKAQPITSCLSGSGGSFRRALLEVVASGVASSPEELLLYTQCTLWHHLGCTQAGDKEAGVLEDLDKALQFLVDYQLIHLQGEGQERCYRPSQLGRAVLASGLSPDDALAMVGELERARRSLALDTDLHLVYLVTPAHLSAQLGPLDWGRYQELWERLPPAQRRVAAMVDVDEACIARAAGGRPPGPGYTKDACCRFYLALALDRLASERPLAEVAHTFACARGLLQSLQQGAATFAGMVCVLCQRLGWRHLGLLVSEFQARLHFGVQPELCPLLALPSLEGPLARLLFDMGYTDPTALAQAAPRELDIALRNAGPFQGRGEARTWQLGAHGTVSTTQLADILVQEARAVVEKSLGAAIAWGEQQATSTQAASARGASADGTTQDDGLQETEERKSTSPGITTQDSSGDSQRSDLPPSCAALPLREVQVVASQRASVEGRNGQPSPEAVILPEEADKFDPVGVIRKEEISQSSQALQSLPWPSLQPGGTIAHLGSEAHDSDDSERLMLDEILGSLPVGPPSSQEDARKRSADSPASAKVPDTDLDDAILLWENDSSPLFSHTAERTRQSQALPNANHPFVASPGEKSYKLSGSFSMDTQTLSADKENTAPLLPKDGTPVRMKEAPARIHDSRKEGIVCASTYTVLKSAAVHVASSGGRGVLTPQSGKSGRDDVNASPAATTSQEGCGEMGESFSFGSSSPFQDTIVPRASKVRSPPVASSRSVEQATDQVAGTLSPRRDSYRFSASFVLDSQTVKAMEGITIQAADVHDTPDVSNVVTKDGAADDTLPKSPLRESHSSEISLGACSLGASTLSELFSSPGSEARQLDRSDPGSERSTRSSKSSGSRKRSASDGELFPSTDDSDLSADSLADQVREAFAWEQVRSVDEFIRRWAKHKEFAMALAVAKHVERETSIGLRRSARLQTKPRESPFVTDGKCLKGIAVCWENYRAHFLPLDNLAASSLESLSHCLKGAKQVVLPDVPLALRFLARPCGLDPARLGWEEPRTAHWLLDPNRGEAELSEMVDQWAPYLEPLFEGDGQLEEVAAREAVLVWNLQKPLMAALKKADLYTLYIEQELRMLGMLCKMDLNGFGYDPERAAQTMADAERALDALQTDAWALAGRRFTLSSCQQVSIVLKAQVVPLAKGSLPPGGLWTKPVLERLSALHPLPAKILDWRKLNCVLTKILRPLGSHRRRHGDSGGALPRIHPWSRPWSTTGRAALTNPNLQGMAKGFVVCTQPPVTIAARAAFRAPPGWVLLSVDYSQVELRLLAHLSEDERLCGAFRAGGDVFRRMAALWSHCAEDAVDNTLRQRTKQICYGITYGQGSQSLANELGVERSEADAMIAQFWQAFPGLHRYSKRVLEQARASGEVRTLLGRRRPLPDLRSKRDAERGRAERQVLNTTVQGSAADLLRRSLLALDDSLGREFPESRGLLQPDRPHKGGAHLVLQLHDEILLEVWERDLPPVAALVRQCMEGAVPLRVPLAVRLHAGPDWARLQELTDLH